MEPDPISKINQDLRRKMKESEERMASFKKKIAAFNERLYELYETSNKIKKKEAEYMLKYFKGIQIKLEKLNVTEACHFLRAEKRKYVNKVIEAKIREDGYNRKYYQKVIDEIIEPLLKDWGPELEYINSLPLSQPVGSSENVLTPETIEDQKQIETTKTSITPIIVEEVVPEIIEEPPELPGGFAQIECEASKEQILNYFMILTKEKNPLNGEPYMDDKDVEEFVKKNFSVSECAPTGKYFPVNLLPGQNKTLIYFIYQFYLKYDRKLANTKMKYVMLLIYNFSQFKNAKPKSLCSNMSETKKPKSSKDIIPIKPYL
jgi:hypothetical protein